MAIDESVAKELGNLKFLREDRSAHGPEHSIEVQLPILKYIQSHSPAWAGFDTRFVPVCIMNIDYSDEFMHRCMVLGEHIAGIIRSSGSIGIIASSDFSHYIPPETIEKHEMQVIKSILGLDVPGFFDALYSSNASVCGYGPIAVLLSAAKELALDARLVHSSNSGGTSSVSYRAVCFEEKHYKKK
jgi:AmmeMemoRadiSam system protein B